ncbi:MAG: carbohydrate ABC transporter permease [Candidatus Cloacimonetes bacterium]|nr:carbohydrate ABC transporter permease [Candidatus Cloacimonadota bacterium]
MFNTNGKLTATLNKSYKYIFLLIFGMIMILPFVWMLTTSMKSQFELNKGNIGFLPIEKLTIYNYDDEEYIVKRIKAVEDSSFIHIFNNDGEIVRAYAKVSTDELKDVSRWKFHWENYLKAFKKVPFSRYFANTIFVSISILIGVLITSSLAAYAFARMKFVGRDFIFYLFISMMMVPQPIYLIPSYVLLNSLGWIDTYQALIIPWLANIFTIFLLRQHFKTIPQELFDAAAIDGCSRFRILWTIVLPLSKSIVTTTAIFSVIGSWNSFMWPLVMTNSDELRVIQVGLSNFSSEASSQTSLLMAASAFSILPLLLLFLFAQKRIISSFASSGMKD